MKLSRQNLIIVARYPQLGIGKRRLAADIGNVAALWFQRQAVATLKRNCTSDPRWKNWMAIAPDRPRDWTAPCTALSQGTGDLGARLERIISAMPHGPVVVIGSDSPQVRAQDIASAFAKLRRADAVFGPSVDGGFWLAGIRQPNTCRPFRNVRWSSSFTLADVLGNLSGRSVALLKPLEDVDDGPSLKRLRAASHR